MERKNMKKLLVVLALIAGAAAPARAGIYYDLTQSASSATLRMVGAFKMYAASMGAAPSLSLDSVTGSMTASSATFTATGSSNYAVTTTTGVYVGGANTGVVAYFFKALGAFYGNLIGNVTGNLTGNVTGNVTGTAATITGNVTESQVTNLTTDLAAKASTGTNIDITSINALGVSKSSPVFTGTFGIGGSPSGTRKFQVYFNANNNSPSYGDGAVRYLDSVNGVGFECGALYGGSQPSWCQSGNDGMGSKKPFVFQPDGSNVGIRTLSPATTAALEVAGPVSVGGSGNTQYSLQASSGASFGSDIHVTGTLEATKLKGDGSQITGIGGGGTVTTQGSPAAGQVAVFQAGTVISTGPFGPVLTSTADYSAPLINAEWTPVASTHVWSAATQVDFFNIVSTTPAGCANVYPEYKLSINGLAAGTAGNFAIRFSTGPGLAFDATAANYVYAAKVQGAGSGDTVGTDSTMCTMAYPGGTFKTGSPIQGDFRFRPKPGNNHRVRGVYFGNSAASSDVEQIEGVAITGCDWGHTANIGPLYGLRFFNTAGTFTGDFTLYIKCGR
jgi:hypothetical protein